MIEIVMEKERNLKNVKQIGTPREEDKIYIENLAYSKLREESYKEKRVFVLMGHTEKMEGRYATFVEAVIPVKDMEFSGNVPHWNNGMWRQVFREIKRIYEDMIIVGWAVDIKGMAPSMTPELERIHREHFGGVHQLVFLMDSLEQDETFYIYKENRLVPKDGFYIYYHARKNEPVIRQDEVKASDEVEVLDLNIEENHSPEHKMVDLDIHSEQQERPRGGRYRQMMAEQKKPAESGNGGLAIAVAMLVFIIAVGAYENRDSFLGEQGSPSTEAGVSNENSSSEEADTSAGAEEPVEIDTSKEGDTSKEADAPGGSEDIIPVEVVPGTENSGT